jgi:hypothetical protein
VAADTTSGDPSPTTELAYGEGCAVKILGVAQSPESNVYLALANTELPPAMDRLQTPAW